MKNIVLLFLFLVPAFLFAQYPTGTNKSRLGYQTTGDGLIWRGVAADTAIKPRTTANAYFQLDTVNRVLRRYIATQGSWQVVGATPDLSAYLLKSDTAAMLDPYVQGAGTVNNLVKFTGSRVVGDAAITENGSRVVMGLPQQFKSYSTVGMPTLSDLDIVENSTTGFLTRYKTGVSENIITSIGAANGQVSVFSSAGKAYGTNNLFWDNTNTRLGVGTNAPVAKVNIASANGGVNQTLALTQLANNVSAGSSYISVDFNVPTTGLIGQFFGTANNYSNASINLMANSVGLLAEATSGQLLLGAAGSSGYISFNTGGYALANERMRILSDGKIGIGTSIPSADLEISKNVNAAAFTSTINTNTGSGVYSYSIWRASSTSNRFGYLGKFGENAPTYKNMKPGDFFFSNTGTLGDMSFLNDYASGNFNVSVGASSTPQLTLHSTGNLLLGTTTNVTGYQLNIVGTGAVAFPRGSVAHRPTIASSTSPLRFNTDSIALEYGESVGTWRQIATRAYARSLVNALSPDTWLGTRLNTGDVDINANAHQLQIDSISNLLLTSQSTAQLGGAYIEQKKWINTARTKYIARGFLHDSRVSVSGGMPAFYNLLYLNNGAGDLYEWTNEMLWDTTTNSIKYGFGSKFQIGFMKFTSARASSGTIEQNTPRFQYNGTSATENENANTYHSIWQERPGVMLMGLKDGGKFLLNSDSTMIFDPAIDVPQFNKMGVGNKEAADLSKTQSNYIAGFATDGTVLDYSLSNLPNGIYTGSGTLASHTTRAAIPSTGNLLFTQKYNSNADSAYIQVINDLDGNREVRLGLTDTSSTGFATMTLKQDADNEVMAWDLRSSDGLGATRLTGDGGNISATVDEGFEVQISGMVRAKREAYAEITSTSSPQTFSNTYSDNFVNQGGTQASFTFLFPASPEDGQILSITWGNAISVVTLDGNGNTIEGTAVTTATAGTRRQFKYYASAAKWFKIY